MFEASGPAIASVAELLGLLGSKDESLLKLGLRSLLQNEQSQIPLFKYCRSEPSVPRIMKLFNATSMSVDLEAVAQILRLVSAALRILATEHAATASQLAKDILDEGLRPIYRCLAAHQPICQAAACELLCELCQDGATVSLMVALFDFGHAGLAHAAKQRNPSDPALGRPSCPRAYYTNWVLRLLKMADYETRVSLSRQPAVLHLVIEGLFSDPPNVVLVVLASIRDRLVFNEEENRNLPVAFLRANQLPILGRLLSHHDNGKQKTVKKFLRSCFSAPDKGLCYPVEVYHVLRNRLLADLVMDLNIRDYESVQAFALELMSVCPDVAWYYLASGRVPFEMSNPLVFSVQAALAIKLLGLCGCAQMTRPGSLSLDASADSPAPSSSSSSYYPVEALCPGSLGRSFFTRGISNSDGTVQFNTLLLMLALLQRIKVPPPDAQSVLMLRSLMPDFRTIYNMWHRQSQQPPPASGGEDELGPMLLQCFLEVVSEYLRLRIHDHDFYTYLKAQDIWSVGRDEQCSASAVKLCTLLDPVPLLASAPDTQIFKDLCLRACADEDAQALLTAWIQASRTLEGGGDERSEEEMALLASALARNPETRPRILDAIHEIHHRPLIYPVGTRPLCQYLLVREEAELDDLIQAEAEHQQQQQQSVVQNDGQNSVPPTADGTVPNVSAEAPPSAKRAKVTMPSFETIEAALMGTEDAAASLHALLAQGLIRRNAVMESLSSISPRTHPDHHFPGAGATDLRGLLHCLLGEYKFTAWLALLAAALCRSNNGEAESSPIDVRLLIESGILTYPIIGLSLEDDALRRTSHLILCRFTILLGQSRLRERRQIELLLNSLASQSSPEDPLAPLPRLLVYFYAEALPLLLRPEHPLYRPLNEVLLSEALPSVTFIFYRFFFDTNDEWEHELTWALGWADRALGRDGEFVHDCDLESLHLVENAAILLVAASRASGGKGGNLDNAKRLARRVLRKCSPPWLAPFTALLLPTRTPSQAATAHGGL